MHAVTAIGVPTTYDVVVIGGGAAGLSAALVLARSRRRVCVVDAGAPRNAPAAQMHGFLSRDGMTPADLLAARRAEVAGYGGEFVDEAVQEILRPPFANPGDLGQLVADTGCHQDPPCVQRTAAGETHDEPAFYSDRLEAGVA